MSHVLAILAVASFAVGALKASAAEPAWAWLFLVAIVFGVAGAIAEGIPE